MEEWIMKYEWRKQEKNLYGVKQTPIIVEVPKQKFILVKGKGNPNEVDFSDRISALYSCMIIRKVIITYSFLFNIVVIIHSDTVDF